MTLATIMHRGVGLAINSPALRIATGNLIAGVGKAAYETVSQHFTLTGDDLADALSDSFERSLVAIDNELNGGLINTLTRSRLERSYQSRVRERYFEPFCVAQGLDTTDQENLCQALRQARKARKAFAQQSAALFPVQLMGEFDVAALFSETDTRTTSALLLARLQASNITPALDSSNKKPPNKRCLRPWLAVTVSV